MKSKASDKSVTIPMVQSVYGSQPQIRAGIGPTEPVRQMSEQELRRETLSMGEGLRQAVCKKHGVNLCKECFPEPPASEQGLVTKLENLGFDGSDIRDALEVFRPYVRLQVEAGRLDEAKWWEHLVGAVQPNHPEGFHPDCIYCRRIAAIRARKDAHGRLLFEDSRNRRKRKCTCPAES